MSDLIENLKKFNSKERFFLVGQILGKQNFKLSEEFRINLSSKLDIAIPDNAFSAMDYHIDWLYASLCLQDSHPKYDNDEKIIEGHQQDIDWLIVFNSQDKYHIILIEAKGVTGWKKNQMKQKIKRLNKVFGEEGKKFSNVEPYFVTMSPSPLPETLELDNWLKWTKKPIWLELIMPKDLHCVQRCNDGNNRDKNGNRWKVKSRHIKRKENISINTAATTV